MKILVTGAAGFLGSWICERLVKDGHEVIGIDNLLGGYEDNVPSQVKFIKGDAGDPELLARISKGVDIIYHLAAAPHEGLSVFSPYLVTKHTYLTSVAVYIAAIKNKIKRVIFTSSMARYGENKIPFTEDMIPKPKDPYGVAKVASEQLFEIMYEAFGIEYVVAVPHNIIGPRQKYDDPYRNVVSIFINRMLQGKQPIIYGDGEQKRTFSDVRDCVDCLIKMMDPEIVPSGEIINIGPGPDHNFISINELAKLIAEKLNFELNPIYVPARPQEVKFATCSDEKARKLLGYKPKYKLEETIDEMIKWIKERGPKPFIYHLDLEIVNEKTPITWREKEI
jgi:UDP-glucose 4-epimerase